MIVMNKQTQKKIDRVFRFYKRKLMRDFICWNCRRAILHDYKPNKAWFVFGTHGGDGSIDDCGTHEVIAEFDTQDEALEYISTTNPGHYDARIVSDDAQK